MGERQEFQPLTREDRITVVLYRIGIVASSLIVAAAALLLRADPSGPGVERIGLPADLLLYGLYAAVGMSVFFIHLYIGTFKKHLKNLYLLGLGCLAALLILGKGSPSDAIVRSPAGPLMLLPLAGCLGFVTAKEAFCFQLIEGYLLALLMPAFLVALSAGMLGGRGASSGLVLIAVLLLFFTLRKVFMPIAYDIGDKTAYR